MFPTSKLNLIPLTVLISIFYVGCGFYAVSRDSQGAFLANFDLIGKEKIIFTRGVIDMDCYRCRNGDIIMTDKAIYLFAENKYGKRLAPQDFTEENLYLKAEYSNIVRVKKGGFGDTYLYLKGARISGVGFTATGWSTKPYQIIKKKLDEATEAIPARAQQGDAEAQFLLGNRYYHTNEIKEALKWYHRAADQGHRDAQRRLGAMYINRAPQDVAQGISWYRKAAEQGDGSAARALGDLYYIGQYTPRDLDEAERWYQLAIKHGGFVNPDLFDAITQERVKKKLTKDTEQGIRPDQNSID